MNEMSNKWIGKSTIRPDGADKVTGRAEYAAVTDQEALNALKLVSQLEGIIPALETAHAFAWLEKLCPTLKPGTEIVINCSGRGDKDVNTVAEKFGNDL